MIQENEILSLVLGACVLHFIILSYAELRKNPSIGLLVPAFYMIFLAWLCSALESFFWGAWLNLAEHVLYLSSSLCLLVWVVRLSFGPEGAQD